MKIKLHIIATALSALFFSANSSLAQSRVEAPIFFDDFLFDNAGLPKDNFRLFNLWNVTSGSVDLSGPPITDITGDPIFERFVDLGGSTKDPARFATRVPLPFLAGAIYHLSFRYKSTDGNPSSAKVTIGTRSWTVTTNSTDFQQFSQDFSFPRQLLARLVFQDIGAKDNSGVGLDTVVVTQAVSLPNISPESLGGTSPFELHIGVSTLIGISLQ